MKSNITFKEAILYWLKLGFISFGGPASQISMMYEDIVEKKKWVEEKSFFLRDNIFAFIMSAISSIDIDKKEDFEFANLYLSKKI